MCFLDLQTLALVRCLQILRKKREKKVKKKSDSLCAIGLLIEEVLDMGYFCHCLSEGVKEEGLQCAGYGYGDYQSVVEVDGDDNSLQEEEHNVETIAG